MKVFVIIVTYNGMQWYDRCFVSLRTSKIPVQTIAIDNSPTDEDMKYIKTHFPEVHLIKTNENLGFGRANNVGIRYALDHDCDYVFLLNQDAWIFPETFEILIDAANKYPEYGILCPMHLAVSEDRLDPGAVEILKDKYNTDEHLFDDMYFNRVGEIYETKYMHAAGWLLPRKTLEMVGGFDPIYLHYAEDDDYMNRLHYHHYKIGVCPASRMVHDRIHDRPALATNELRRHRQSLILQFTNINKQVSFERETWKMIKNAIKHILLCRWSKASNLFQDYRYLVQMKSRILQSREQNVKTAPSWL